jgi:hypothetical protein
MIPLVGDQTGAFSGLEMFRDSKTGTPTAKEMAVPLFRICFQTVK